MIHRIKQFGLLILLGCVAGCHSQIPQLNHAAQQKPTCCKQYSQMSFQPLAKGGTEVSITRANPVYPFKTGKSFFAAYRLPKNSNQLKLTTFVVGEVQPYSHVFYPYVIFLDENFKQTHLVHGPYKFGTRWFKTPYLSGTIPVREHDRYLVIYTNPKVFRYYMMSQAELHESLPEALTLKISEVGVKKSVPSIPIPFAAAGRLHLTLS